MSFDSPALRKLLPYVWSIILATAGGGVLAAMNVPAGWMSGAMIAVAIAALAGQNMVISNRLRNVLFVVMGLSMGSGVTPDVLDRVGHWPWTMAGLVVVVALVTAATTAYLHIVTKWDTETAYFGALPGALSLVILLASEREKVDLARIAVSQSTRLLFLVAILPILITATTSYDPDTAGAQVLSSPTELLILAVLCTLASYIAARLRVPGAWLTGAFFMSAGLNVAGILTVGLPNIALIPCYIALGLFVGSRLTGTGFRAFLQMMVAGLGAVLVGLVVSAGLAWIFAKMLGLPFGQLLLAYAPGGLEAVTLLAFILDLDPAFVVSHQLARYICMLLLLPVVTRFLLGDGRRKD